jgi:hypothetical protein
VLGSRAAAALRLRRKAVLGDGGDGDAGVWSFCGGWEAGKSGVRVEGRGVSVAVRGGCCGAVVSSWVCFVRLFGVFMCLCQ